MNGEASGEYLGREFPYLVVWMLSVSVWLQWSPPGRWRSASRGEAPSSTNATPRSRKCPEPARPQTTAAAYPKTVSILLYTPPPLHTHTHTKELFSFSSLIYVKRKTGLNFKSKLLGMKYEGEVEAEGTSYMATHS